VLIQTPTTLLATLHAVAHGWQQERVAESAQAISKLGRDLYGRLVKLSSLIAALGKRLNSTVVAYNETVASYEARVLPGAKKFADYGAVAEGSSLPQLEPVTISARTLQEVEPVLAEDESQPPAPRLRAAAE
jgi:DNA recombination protein RmuC